MNLTNYHAKFFAHEQARIEEEAAAARIAEYDAEMRRRVEEAARRDADPQDRAGEQREREREAREVAGIGYRLQENITFTSSMIKNHLTETVTDCARACAREDCDAFAFDRAGDGPGSRRPRSCYFLSAAPHQDKPPRLCAWRARFQFTDRSSILGY